MALKTEKKSFVSVVVLEDERNEEMSPETALREAIRLPGDDLRMDTMVDIALSGCGVALLQPSPGPSINNPELMRIYQERLRQRSMNHGR